MVGALKAAWAKLLMDVRAVPQSRSPAFSASSRVALDEAGIGYVHLQGLGTPKPGRYAVRAGHPERMEVIFREHMTSDRALPELAEAKVLALERPACLLCFKRDHQTCHRRLVAEMIVAETRQAVVHLGVLVPGSLAG